MFQKNQRVVRIIRGYGGATAALHTIESVTREGVRLVGDNCLAYDKDTGREIDPAIPGFSSEIVVFEGDE